MTNSDFVRSFSLFCKDQPKEPGLKILARKIHNGDIKVSCAQNFEDIYLTRIFGLKNKIFYVDVGASHPWFSSVTALFYYNGSNGINVDADPRSISLLQSYRKYDVNIHALVSSNNTDTCTFFLHEKPSRSTASNSYLDGTLFDLEHLEEVTMETQTLNNILSENNCPKKFDLLKIDIEGYEYQALSSLDLNLYQPRIIIVESIPPYDMRTNLKDKVINQSQLIDEYLKIFNYEDFFSDGVNRWFCKCSEADHLRQEMSIPLSVIDQFVALSTFEAMIRCNIEFFDLL